MLYNLIQGKIDVVVDTAPMRGDTNEVLHGIMIAVCDGGIDENGEDIARRVTPRKIVATGSYVLIEFKGTIE